MSVRRFGNDQTNKLGNANATAATKSMPHNANKQTVKPIVKTVTLQTNAAENVDQRSHVVTLPAAVTTKTVSNDVAVKSANGVVDLIATRPFKKRVYSPDVLRALGSSPLSQNADVDIAKGPWSPAHRSESALQSMTLDPTVTINPTTPIDSKHRESSVEQNGATANNVDDKPNTRVPLTPLAPASAVRTNLYALFDAEAAAASENDMTSCNSASSSNAAISSDSSSKSHARDVGERPLQASKRAKGSRVGVDAVLLAKRLKQVEWGRQSLSYEVRQELQFARCVDD
jgi:hypothetical protein